MEQIVEKIFNSEEQVSEGAGTESDGLDREKRILSILCGLTAQEAKQLLAFISIRLDSYSIVQEPSVFPHTN